VITTIYCDRQNKITIIDISCCDHHDQLQKACRPGLSYSLASFFVEGSQVRDIVSDGSTTIILGSLTEWKGGTNIAWVAQDVGGSQDAFLIFANDAEGTACDSKVGEPLSYVSKRQLYHAKVSTSGKVNTNGASTSGLGANQALGTTGAPTGPGGDNGTVNRVSATQSSFLVSRCLLLVLGAVASAILLH
jgi:hypothetical protein